MLLSILIPTTSDREGFFAVLMTELSRQVRVLSEWHNEDYWRHVEILKDPHGPEVSIGSKRNALLKAATGKYVRFIDSDDMVVPDLLKTELPLLRENPDCLSLRGIMTTNGLNPEIFEHSLKYSEWRTTEHKIKYERYPNHLNCIRADLAKQFKFPEINRREDHIWSKALYESGLLKNEIYIDKVLYYYKYRTKK